MHRTTRRTAPLAATLALAVGLPAAALATPPTVTPSRAIESLARYDAQDTCSPTSKAGTLALRSLVTGAYPGTGDLGIVRACAIGGTSEHKEGRAWDWKINAYDAKQDAQAKDFLAWLLATDAYGNEYAQARRLGIMYVIYNQHIWSASQAEAGWRPYTGPNPHVDHVHISLSWDGADKLTSYWTGKVASGSSVLAAAPAISAYWSSLGGAKGLLGDPTSAPYTVEGGNAQDFEGGIVYWSSKTGTHAVYGDVAKRYALTGGPDGPLGLPVSEESAAPGGGRMTVFAGGRIYWSATTGAHSVQGGILAEYLSSGGSAGTLGLPTTSEADVPGGRGSTFQRGRIIWSPTGGAHALWGDVLARYLATGGPAGPLGVPTSDEQGAPGGVFTTFAYGRITWSATAGAHSAWGGIGARYAALGGAAGPLGIVLADEADVPGGRMTRFVGGRLYWSPSTGVVMIDVPTAVRYDALGGPGGGLGLPLADKAVDGAGRGSQPFAGGRAFSSAATGTVVLYGDVLRRYEALGGPASPLGMPVSPEAGVGTGTVAAFQGGRVYWSPSTGAVPVSGLVLGHLDAVGGVTGYLGMPITAVAAAAPGLQHQVFVGGRVYVRGGGAHDVRGAVLQAYLVQGGPTGRLGAPTSDEYSVPGGQRSDFERGRLTWSASTGQVSVAFS